MVTHNASTNFLLVGLVVCAVMGGTAGTAAADDRNETRNSPQNPNQGTVASNPGQTGTTAHQWIAARLNVASGPSGDDDEQR